MNITVKGVDDKILINLARGEWEARSKELLAYIKENASFLLGARVILSLDDFNLKVNDLFEVKDTFSDLQLNITAIQSNQEGTRQAARLLGIPLEDTNKPKGIALKGNQVDRHNKNLFIEKTLRSGSLTETDGNVTILADVHPGAVIRATGSVVVWGYLKGEVHAGISGDLLCVICALSLAPTNLSIAGIQLENTPKKIIKLPQIARCAQNTITIEAWKS